MKAIVCVSKNWGIGKDNGLLFNIKEDMENFKKLTTGKVCVMGYNTLLSLPKGRPLPNRTSIVLCKDNIKIEGATVCKSLDELFAELKKYEDENICVMGGASIYKQLLPFCSEVILTKVEEEKDADVFFPNLDEMAEWQIEKTEPLIEGNDKIKLITYVQKIPQKYFKTTTAWDDIYIGLCKKILSEGVQTPNRTGTDTIKIPGFHFELDVQKEFPILTSKFVGWKSAFKEIMWIYQAQSNDVRWLTDRNVKIWNEWKIDEDGYYQGKFFGKEFAHTIGTAYGYVVKKYGLMDRLLKTLKTNPTDRRMIISLWQEECLPTATLPSCVWNTMWDVTSGKLNVTVCQRSCDVPLGLPFNVSQYAALLCMVAHATGFEVGTMAYTIKDAQIYVNQVDGIKEQIEIYEKQGGYPAPKLYIDPNVKSFYDFDNKELSNINLVDYKSHKKIVMKVSV